MDLRLKVVILIVAAFVAIAFMLLLGSQLSPVSKVGAILLGAGVLAGVVWYAIDRVLYRPLQNMADEFRPASDAPSIGSTSKGSPPTRQFSRRWNCKPSRNGKTASAVRTGSPENPWRIRLLELLAEKRSHVKVRRIAAGGLAQMALGRRTVEPPHAGGSEGGGGYGDESVREIRL